MTGMMLDAAEVGVTDALAVASHSSSGSIITLPPGTFRGPITLPPNTRLQGAGRATVIDASGRPLLLAASSSDVRVGINWYAVGQVLDPANDVHARNVRYDDPRFAAA